MVAFILKGMTSAETYKHIFCPYTHPKPQGWGQRSKQFFLKVVMLHIKLKEMEQIYTVHVHIMSLHTPSIPRVESKVKTFFLKLIMLNIKLKGRRMQPHATLIFFPCGVKGSKHFFLSVVMLHIKLKEMEQTALCKRIFCPHTHSRLLWWGQNQNIFF